MTKEKIKKDEEIDILKHWIALGSFIGFMILIFFIGLVQNLHGDEMIFKFKSPSFSGINTSQHYLTIENQENTNRGNKSCCRTNRKRRSQYYFS